MKVSFSNLTICNLIIFKTFQSALDCVPGPPPRCPRGRGPSGWRPCWRRWRRCSTGRCAASRAGRSSRRGWPFAEIEIDYIKELPLAKIIKCPHLRYLTATFARPGHMYLCAAYSVVSAVITDCSCTDSLYRYLQISVESELHSVQFQRHFKRVLRPWDWQIGSDKWTYARKCPGSGIRAGAGTRRTPSPISRNTFAKCFEPADGGE